jgi:magnesium-transporting ATPase (P-type)
MSPKVWGKTNSTQIPRPSCLVINRNCLSCSPMPRGHQTKQIDNKPWRVVHGLTEVETKLFVSFVLDRVTFWAICFLITCGCLWYGMFLKHFRNYSWWDFLAECQQGVLGNAYIIVLLSSSTCVTQGVNVMIPIFSETIGVFLENQGNAYFLFTISCFLF